MRNTENENNIHPQRIVKQCKMRVKTSNKYDVLSDREEEEGTSSEEEDMNKTMINIQKHKKQKIRINRPPPIHTQNQQIKTNAKMLLKKENVEKKDFILKATNGNKNGTIFTTDNEIYNITKQILTNNAIEY